MERDCAPCAKRKKVTTTLPTELSISTVFLNSLKLEEAVQFSDEMIEQEKLIDIINQQHLLNATPDELNLMTGPDGLDGEFSFVFFAIIINMFFFRCLSFIHGCLAQLLRISSMSHQLRHHS